MYHNNFFKKRFKPASNKTKLANNFLHPVFQFIILNFSFLIVFSCSPTESVFNDHEITITVDAEVTETWIYLTANPLKKNAIYTVMRDTTIIYKNSLTKGDTLIHDENLEPGRTYSYAVYAKKGGERSDVVDAITTTMDTTSYSYNISTFYIETAIFSDCKIWDTDNFWAVGQYHKKDSLGFWMASYTILSYENGIWDDIRVLKQNDPRQGEFPLPEIKSLYALNKKDVWFAEYDIYKWNGIDISTRIWIGDVDHLFNHIFGFDKTEVYVGGQNGILLKINDQDAKKMDIPESYNIRDIWGDKDRNLIVGASDYVTSKQRILFVENGKIQTEIELKENDFVGTLWFKDIDKIFIGGLNVNIKNRNNSFSTFKLNDIRVITKIRGTDINNIFALTSNGKIFHFNGKSWSFLYSAPCYFTGLYVIEGLAIAVGRDSFGGYVIKIKY